MMTKKAKAERSKKRIEELKIKKTEGKISKFAEMLLSVRPYEGKIDMRAVLK